jgi:hypothetical protein
MNLLQRGLPGSGLPGNAARQRGPLGTRRASAAPWERRAPARPRRGDGSHAIARFASLATILALLATGCGGKDPEPPAPQKPRLEQLAGRAAAIEQQLQALFLKPWRQQFKSLERIAGLHSELVAFVQQAQSPPADAAAREALANRGEALVTHYEQKLDAPLQVLIGGTAVTDRVFELMGEMNRTLDRIGAREDEPFELRRRFRDGWLPSVRENVSMLDQGLVDFEQKGDLTRIRAAATGLNSARETGEKLSKMLTWLAASLDQISKSFRALQVMVDEGRRLVEKSEAATGTSRPSDAELAAAREKLQIASEMVADEAKNHTFRKEQLALAPGPNFDELMTRMFTAKVLDAIRIDLREKLDPLAAKLGASLPR